MWECARKISKMCMFCSSGVSLSTAQWYGTLASHRKKINVLERVQKTSLRIILGESYISYQSALDTCNLKTLSERRDDRCMTFANKCLKHHLNRRLFPLNTNCHDLHDKPKEKFIVNFAKTGALKKSAIPYLQRRLNSEHTK